MQKMYNVKINDKTVQDILVKRCSWIECIELGDMIYYKSPCRRYTLSETEYSNMMDVNTGKGWQLHIDNSDMCTIGHCDVEYIGQITELMKIYANY